MEQPPLPDAFGHLLAYMPELPSPLSWGELEAWARMTHRRLARWEIDLLFEIDRIRSV